MSKKLSELSDRELAPLFNMTIPEVRRYRRGPEYAPQDAAPAEMRTKNERYRKWLWNWSVEEFKMLRDSDERLTVRAFLREVPVYVAGRFRYLQELSEGRLEFEARYPAAFEVLYPQSARRRERNGLHLPSFDVRILHNWNFPRVEEQISTGSADAYTSVSNWWEKDWRTQTVYRYIQPGEALILESPPGSVCIHVTLHKALKQAVSGGLIPRNVTEAVKPPQVRGRRYAR